MDGGTVIKQVNLNTIVIAVGFLATFASIVYSYSNLQAEQRNFGEFIEEQRGVNAKLDARVSAQNDTLGGIPYQVGQLQKAQESTEERIGRVTESYSNQFGDIRMQLSNIGTQVALVKQSLDRIEAWRTADRHPTEDAGP